jgi:replicative DNA helicase
MVIGGINFQNIYLMIKKNKDKIKPINTINCSNDLKKNKEGENKNIEFYV